MKKLLIGLAIGLALGVPATALAASVRTEFDNGYVKIESVTFKHVNNTDVEVKCYYSTTGNLSVPPSLSCLRVR